MPNDETSVADIGQSDFWDQFEDFVPDAVRCRFFSTAMGIAHGRATAYSQESGPFLMAVRTTHLPVAIKRLGLLKEEVEKLATFYPEDNPSSRHVVRRRAGQVIIEAGNIVADFEQNITNALLEVEKGGDESQARQVIKSLIQIAARIAQYSEERFDRAVEELEKAVAHSVICSESVKGFVSCVSLDLAQYGTHAKVLHDHAGAGALLLLNEKIQSEISANLRAQDVPSDQVIIIDTGDGAILIFTSDHAHGKTIVANRAYGFSVSFLNSVSNENKGKDQDNQLHFRVGICSGVIAGTYSRIRQSEITQCRVGGVPLATAVRLQSAARTGEIIACATTWQGLPSEVQNRFGNQEQVLGKIHEKHPILAHRFACVPPRPEERS